MKRIFLTVLMSSSIGTGCGRDESNSSNAATAEKPTLQSIAIASMGDLPECSEANNTQLAYIKDEKAFYVCEGNDWNIIDDAPVEVLTVKGKNGSNGSDGATVTTNNWYDAVTGKLWLIGANVHYSVISTSCVSPWRLPTKQEALAAAQRGLGVAATTISGPTTMWTSTPYNVGTSQTYITAISTSPAEAEHLLSSGTFRGLFCIEE